MPPHPTVATGTEEGIDHENSMVAVPLEIHTQRTAEVGTMVNASGAGPAGTSHSCPRALLATCSIPDPKNCLPSTPPLFVGGGRVGEEEGILCYTRVFLLGCFYR